jgi:hypothetical protein
MTDILPAEVATLEVGQSVTILFNPPPDFDVLAAARRRSRPGTGRRQGPWESFMYQVRGAVRYRQQAVPGPRYQVKPQYATPDGSSPYFGAIGNGARVVRLS